MNITKKLIENNLIWKIDDNIWARRCPKCNNIVYHKGESSLEVVSRSYRKNCNCVKCNSVGRKFSYEQRKRLSESHKGYKHTKEQTRKISEANRGKIRTEEMRIKYSCSKLGNKNPQFGKPTWNKGREWSDKIKQKLSISHIGQKVKHSEETKKKIRIAILKRLEKQKILSIDKNAPEFFKKLNESGYNFQPKRFFEIGYDSDGYDSEKHIWIEYDTPYHRNITQQKKDLIRQNNIINYFKSINKPLLGFLRVIENKSGKLNYKCVYGNNIFT